MKNHSYFSKHHKLRKEISNYSLRVYKMPAMDLSNLSRNHELRNKSSSSL